MEGGVQQRDSSEGGGIFGGMQRQDEGLSVAVGRRRAHRRRGVERRMSSADGWVVLAQEGR